MHSVAGYTGMHADTHTQQSETIDIALNSKWIPQNNYAYSKTLDRRTLPLDSCTTLVRQWKRKSTTVRMNLNAPSLPSHQVYIHPPLLPSLYTAPLPSPICGQLTSLCLVCKS